MNKKKSPEMKNNLFTKEERSTFKYWFAHWCAYNMVALNCGHWKFKYLFHDFLKPWLKLFMPYDKLQKWHRTHANHHLEKFIDGNFKNADWEGMIIDWECSRYTKYSAQKTAFETIPFEVERFKDKDIKLFVYYKLVETCRELKFID